MGVALLLVGYIQEAWPGYVGDHEEKLATAIELHNNRIISALPDEDDSPPVCKSMFACPSARLTPIAYQNRLFHFAASLKNCDFMLRRWCDKFQSLLRQLYWEQAYVHVDGGYIGSHEMRWSAKQDWIDALCSGLITPIVEWEFETTIKDLDSLIEE